MSLFEFEGIVLHLASVFWVVVSRNFIFKVFWDLFNRLEVADKVDLRIEC